MNSLQEIYHGNYKTLLKEIKEDLNKWRHNMLIYYSIIYYTILYIMLHYTILYIVQCLYNSEKVSRIQ